MIDAYPHTNDDAAEADWDAIAEAGRLMQEQAVPVEGRRLYPTHAELGEVERSRAAFNEFLVLL